MRLRRLDILGFKSFRTRTAVEIGDGVTAIVGPNGCGKSNIVDAIRWALGAQNARDLRGRDMADVIFAGSESHPPMGFAEVSLVFENDRLDLPLPWRDVPEVRITRRLHRTGESEYEINGASSRLRDLTELFLGTGVGSREAYSIIEQGKVGFIVQARPEERRVLIEEAAGITRYRYQRRTAERRLETTRANLTRLHDILGEVARQLASLERQAQRAARWRELAARRRELEITSLVERHQRLADELAALSERSRSHEDARAAATAALARAEATLESARVEWFVVEKRMTAAAERAYEARARSALLANNLGHLRREAAETLSRRERLERDRDEQIRLAERAAGESSAVDLELAALVASEANDASALAQAEAALRAAREERSAAAEAMRSVSNELTRLRGEIGSAQARLESLRSEVERLAVRAADAGTTLASQRSEAVACARQTDDARAALDLATAALTANERIFDEARAAEQDARERLSVAQREEREASSAREVAATRVAGLERSLASGAGYADGPRQVLAAAQKGELPGVLRPLAERLRVDTGREAVVATALGGWLDAVLVENADTLVAVGRWARSRRLAVRLLAMDSCVDGELLPGCVAVEGVPFFVVQRLREVSVVLDVLDADPGAAAAVDPLRGVREPGGALSIGAPGGGATEQVFALTRDLDAARVALVGADARRAEASETRSRLDAELEAALHRREDARGSLDHARTTVGAARVALDAATARSRAMESATQRLQDDVAHAEARRHAVETEIEQLVGRLAALREAETERAAQQTRATARAEVADREESAIADRFGALRATHAAATERLRALRQTLERARGTAFAARERARKLGEEAAATLSHHGALVATMERDQAAVVDAERDSATAEAEALEARQAHDAGAARLREAEAAVAAGRSSHDAAVNAGREVELRSERTTAAMQAAEQAVFDRFGISLAHARAEALQGGMTQALQTELSEVVEKLDRLGAVNPNADEEFREAEQRHVFLATQKQDLEAAMADLEAAIRKMDETSRELFAQTYEEVNARFQELFPRLFRGGRARLELTQPDDLLETGIEIVCQPPGKRLQSMTLMSGGEKALSAVALIFAIFQMKPTPFCILDEVDAPLDEGNVVRFSEMVREMSSGSQFLLITHNKRTMEVARTLYGVTMEEPGVSKIVGVRLHGRDDAEGAQQAVGVDAR